MFISMTIIQGKHKNGEKRERDRKWKDAEVEALCQFVVMNKKSLFGLGGHVSDMVSCYKGCLLYIVITTTL